MTPKTDLGKLTTIFYALVGIPLLLLYISTFGQIMGTAFKYTYAKICRCKRPSKSMPSKASLPSALVDPVDNPPQSIDSGGRHSKQSSSRSKISSNSSNTDNPFTKSFKSFRRKSDKTETNHNTEVNNSILYRRPSFVVTSENGDLEAGGGQNDGFLKPPEAINLTPPSPAPSTTSFLKTPGFLKVRHFINQISYHHERKFHAF